MVVVGVGMVEDEVMVVEVDEVVDEVVVVVVVEVAAAEGATAAVAVGPHVSAEEAGEHSLAFEEIPTEGEDGAEDPATADALETVKDA